MSNSSRISSMRSMISPNAKGGSLALDMIHEGYACRAEPSARQRTQPLGPRPSKAASHDSESWYGVKLEAQTQFPAANRRSRCGSVRGCPVVSSHFLPGPAPHVGQRTACTCLRLGFLAFTVVYDAETRRKKMFNLIQKSRIVVEIPSYH